MERSIHGKKATRNTTVSKTALHCLILDKLKLLLLQHVEWNYQADKKILNDSIKIPKSL